MTWRSPSLSGARHEPQEGIFRKTLALLVVRVAGRTHTHTHTKNSKEGLRRIYAPDSAAGTAVEGGVGQQLLSGSSR